jgi:hypothetical protein
MSSDSPRELALMKPAGARARGVRLRGLLVLAPCWGLLAAAAMLTPRASGYGTHRQLDLPACSILARTGYPCPNCGLTTSVSAMAHGRVLAALAAQPFGVVLALAMLVLGGAGARELAAGRPAIPALRVGWWWVWGAAAGMFGGWAIKLAVGLSRGELPVR